MQAGTNYLIEKAFKAEETIFEYAMCFECYEKTQKTLSENSKKLIQNYFEEHVDINNWRNRMLNEHGHETGSWLNNCLIKNTTREDSKEHQIYGWFVGSHLVFNGMPYMLSSEVIDDLLELLSTETLGILDNLNDQLFGIDLPKGYLLV